MVDGCGVVMIRVVRGEVVHDGSSHVLAVFDDRLDVAHGLDGRRVLVGVGRRDATEDAVVDDREIAKRLGVVARGFRIAVWIA